MRPKTTVINHRGEVIAVTWWPKAEWKRLPKASRPKVWDRQHGGVFTVGILAEKKAA